MNIMFMGTPDFAVPSLQILIENNYTPKWVVTRPDLPRGRGNKVLETPVKILAKTHKIPVLTPHSVRDETFIESLKLLDIDVMVVVAFRILPEAVFSQAKKGAFNLHASLLPAFRGAAPINRAIMAGALETGVTTFFLKKQVDTGDMILQEKLQIGENETAGSLHDRLMISGAEAVLKTVQMIDNGTVQTTIQDHQFASPAPKIFKEDCEIQWDTPANEVHNHIRGLSPYPGAWTTLKGKTVKIIQTSVAEKNLPTGKIESDGEKLWVGCKKNAVQIHEIQLEGRKKLSTSDFLRGYSFQPNDFFAS